jgi:hypothetical protein
MAFVFKEIQSIGDGEQPDLLHLSDNEAHVLYTNDGRLYLQTTEPPIGEWADLTLTDKLLLPLDANMEHFSTDMLGGFGGVGSYKTDQSQYLLLYNTDAMENVTYETIITSIEHNYDDNQLNITISNKPYLNDDLNYLTSLWAKANQSAVVVDNSSEDWNKAKVKADEAEVFMNSPINVNDNAILIGDVDSLVQQAQITRRGLITADLSDANGQMRILGDRIVFTNDNWANYSVAISSAGIKTSQNFTLYSDNSVGGNNVVTISGNGIKIYGSGEEGNGLEIYNLLNERTVYLDSLGNANFTGVVTGGTVQTAVSGARIVLKENKLQSYNSKNELSGLVTGLSVDVHSTYQDISIYSRGNKALTFRDEITGIAISPQGGYNLFLGTSGENTFAEGSWTFSSGSSITGLNTDSNGSHSHTITIEGVTYTTSSSGSHTHNVKKA